MSGPAHRVQSAVEEFGYPQGHLGHLNPEQETAFRNFKLMCAEHGYYKPGNGADVEASHDDALLLRFLRARRFVVADAYKQFSETEDWRKVNHLDQLYETIDLEHYEETRRLVCYSAILQLYYFLTIAVPAMDRATRQAWHTCLRLRSEAFELEGYVCI